MRKFGTLTIVAVLVVAVLASGCLLGVVTGSGNLISKEMDFSDFTRVEVGSAFEVEIIQADSYHVSVTADDNLFDYITVAKEGDTLKIALKPSYSYDFLTLRARVTMPNLYALDLSGATKGTVSGFDSSADLALDLSGASSLAMSDMSALDISLEASGASRVTGSIAAGDAEFDVSGASTVTLAGSANDIDIEASGASHVGLGDFPVNNAEVKLSGASRATVNLSGRLDVDLSGASNLSYIGEPTMGDISISGASTISSK
jgi:hypothetical protein